MALRNSPKTASPALSVNLSCVLFTANSKTLCAILLLLGRSLTRWVKVTGGLLLISLLVFYGTISYFYFFLFRFLGL